MNRITFAASATAPLLDVADVDEFVRSGATVSQLQLLSMKMGAQYQAAAATVAKVTNPKVYDLYGFDTFTANNLERVLTNEFLMRLRTHGIVWNTYDRLNVEELWRNTAEGKPGAVIINADVFDRVQVRIATFPLQWQLFWKHTVSVILTKGAADVATRIGWYYWGVPVVELPRVDVTELVGKIGSCQLLIGMDLI